MIQDFKKFPIYRQLEAKDCGPTCLRMILKYYGISKSLDEVTKACETTREGTNLAFLDRAAIKFGFETLMASINFQDLSEINKPSIVHWEGNHFVVVYQISERQVRVADPALGLVDYSINSFLDKWTGTNQKTKNGIALILEPSDDFVSQNKLIENDEASFKHLLNSIRNYKKELFVIFISVLFSLTIQFTLPFFFQIIVDQGIGKNDINFIYLIILFQCFLLVGRLGFEIHRRWCLLQMSSRISLSLLANFFRKLVRLPLSFFDVKLTGDLMQRIIDHKRVEDFVNTASVNIILSVASFIAFSVVLGVYSFKILAIFLTGAMVYLAWVFLFLKKRVLLDHKQFTLQSKVTSSTMEFVNGMQEIRLNNAAQKRISKLEVIYLDILNLSKQSLKLEHIQFSGAEFINELKNILIIVFVCIQVVNDEMSLGMLLSISFIIGQLSGPLSQFSQTIKTWQESELSIRRINEIHKKEDHASGRDIVLNSQSIYLDKISYRYYGKITPALKDISFSIESNSITAIVGSSGSGKTTLLKLLLKYYEPNEGEIRIGDREFRNLNVEKWWKDCGIVMQEGIIFNGSILENISMSEETVDQERLKCSVRISCIDTFISTLPAGFNTIIGQEGIGLSTGQKQRILIARAVYKDPKYLFFDEATSALDTNNEKLIMNNLHKFFNRRTVFIIAHRLSTVMNADKIIVLEDGELVEHGNHYQLVAKRGHYYNLIKNQLELSS
jgi:ATP-binding cassette subfamily B protein